MMTITATVEITPNDGVTVEQVVEALTTAARTLGRPVVVRAVDPDWVPGPQPGDPLTVRNLTDLPVGSRLADRTGMVFTKEPGSVWRDTRGGSITDPVVFVPHWCPVLVSYPTYPPVNMTTKEN